MSHEEKTKLFKLFGFMDWENKLQTKGVGLGLHVSNNIANKIDGNLDCITQQGLGSNFIFVVPLDPVQEQNEGVNRIMNPLHRRFDKIEQKMHIKDKNEVSMCSISVVNNKVN